MTSSRTFESTRVATSVVVTQQRHQVIGAHIQVSTGRAPYPGDQPLATSRCARDPNNPSALPVHQNINFIARL